MAHHTLVRPQTTIAGGPTTLPTGTITVASTAGPPAFPSSGTIVVNTSAGPQNVAYTGKTGTTFTGCTGGTGTASIGAAVYDTWQTILRSELLALDQGVRRGMNDVDGGTGAPTSQLVIGGAGVAVFGELDVAYGATLTTGGNPTISLLDNDWPVIDPVGNTAHSSRTICYDVALARGEKQMAWHVRREDGGLQAWAPMFSDLSDAVGMRPARAWAHIRVHDAATLTSVAVNFRVSTPHTQLPSVMPSFRVFTVDTGGNALLCTSQAAGADLNGYVSVPSPGSPAKWFANAAPQQFVIPIDQNNACSVGTRDYILEIVEQQGLAGFPFQLTFAKPCRLVATSNLSLVGAATIDGIAVATGDRVLATAQSINTQQGIWVASIGTGEGWTRGQDITAATYTQGFVVPITSGATNGNRLLQAPIGAQYDPRNINRTQVWAASINCFPQSVLTVPTNPNGFVYVGSSPTSPALGGATEPIWPTQVGATVGDGTASITWTNVGRDADAISFLGPPDMNNPPDSQGLGLIAHGTIFQCVVAQYTKIQDFRFQ
jgi:hypothetical protein